MSLAVKFTDRTDTWYRVGLDRQHGVGNVYPVMVYYTLNGNNQSRFTGVFARPDQWDVQTERPQRGCKYYRIWMARIHYLLVVLRNYVFEQSARSWKSHYKPRRAFELVLDKTGKCMDGRYQVVMQWNDSSSRKPIKTGLLLKEEEWDASLQIPKQELPEVVDYTAYLDELLHEEWGRTQGQQRKATAVEFSVMLHTEGTAVDGTYPVRICYTNGSQSFYRQTGVFLRESEWDVCSCLPLPDGANYTVQKEIIMEQSKLFQHDVDKAIKDGAVFSQADYTEDGIPMHIGPFLSYQERLLRSNQQFGNAVVYRTVLNDLLACFGDLELSFSAIDVPW